jgi:hypothetical protein
VINKLNLIKRLGILAVLVFCLGFVMFAPGTSQTVAAAPCCSECPVPPGSDISPFDYCTDQCGASSGSCYNSCINQVHNCWRWCSFSC